MLVPKDSDALRELAGLYISLSSEKQRAAQIVQLKATYTGAGQNFPGALTSATGQSLVDDKISQVLNQQSSTSIQTLVTDARTASAAALAAYKKIAALQPGDPNVQLELAQAAQQAGDLPTAIAAYEEFLKLAPDDANAVIVKQQLKQLKQASTSAG